MKATLNSELGDFIRGDFIVQVMQRTTFQIRLESSSLNDTQVLRIIQATACGERSLSTCEAVLLAGRRRALRRGLSSVTNVEVQQELDPDVSDFGDPANVLWDIKTSIVAEDSHLSWLILQVGLTVPRIHRWCHSWWPQGRSCIPECRWET